MSNTRYTPIKISFHPIITNTHKTSLNYSYQKSNSLTYCFFMQPNYPSISLKLFVPCAKLEPEKFPY